MGTMCGRPLRCKEKSSFAVRSGAAMCPAGSTRHLWPLALMKSADRVPITSARLMRLAPVGFSDPRLDRSVITTQPTCTPLPAWPGILGYVADAT